MVRTSEGEYLTENVAILEYITAELKPEAKLAPTGMDRTRMRKWLSFVNGEIRAGHHVFDPVEDDIR